MTVFPWRSHCSRRSSTVRAGPASASERFIRDFDFPPRRRIAAWRFVSTTWTSAFAVAWWICLCRCCSRARVSRSRCTRRATFALRQSTAPGCAPRDVPGETSRFAPDAGTDLDDLAGAARERAPSARVPAAHALRIGARFAGRNVDHDPDLVPCRDAAAAAAPTLASHEPDGAARCRAFGNRPVEADPQRREALDPEHGVAAVPTPGEARFVDAHRAQLPAGAELWRRRPGLAVAPREVLEDSDDHAPAETGGVEAVECRILARVARHLGPLPAELVSPRVRDDPTVRGIEDRREAVGLPAGAVPEEHGPRRLCSRMESACSAQTARTCIYGHLEGGVTPRDG